MSTRVPAIPAPTTNNLLQVAQTVKGVLDVREGLIGDPLDANVTFRDLVDAGIASKKPGFSGGVATLPVLPAWSSPDGYDGSADMTTPDKPTGVTATGLFATIQIQWNSPTYRNHSYAEVWRSSTNAIGNAVLIGTSDSRFYTDSLGTSAAAFYWVRFVSQAGVKGPYSAVNGLSASTSTDPTYVMDVLSDAYGSTSQAPFYQIDAATTINGVLIPAGTYIKQAFIADATISRAKIQDLAVDNAKIASLDAEKINTGFLNADRIQVGTLDAKIANIDAAKITSGTINTALIGDATIGFAKIANDIQSSDYVAGSAGWRINKTGQMEMNNAVFRGELSAATGTFAGNLSAAGGTFAGNLSAAGGTFSGNLSAAGGSFVGTLDVKSAASGARMEIKNNAIKVFDASGVLRVQIGDLTA